MTSTLVIEIPFRFKTVTQQTVSPLAVLRLLCEEAPVNGHSAGVTKNALELAPEQQDKKHMEQNKEQYVWLGLEREHVLNNEYEVVEGHETNDSNKMGVD